MNIEVLLFEVEDKRFGVPSGSVKEVVRAVKLSSLPERSSVIEGLLNLRGRVVPVVDVRAVFSMPAREIHYNDHLIVVETKDRLLTLRVDRATDLVRLGDGDLDACAGQDSQVLTHVGKVGDDVVQVIGVEGLFALPEVGLFDSTASQTELPT